MLCVNLSEGVSSVLQGILDAIFIEYTRGLPLESWDGYIWDILEAVGCYIPEGHMTGGKSAKFKQQNAIKVAAIRT